MQNDKQDDKRNVTKMSNEMSNEMSTTKEDKEDKYRDWERIKKEIHTYVCKEKKLSADAEIFSDEKNSGNNLTPVEQEGKKEKSSARKERTQFVPPTLEEVKDYEAQKGYTFSAEKFWGYYESNGWRVGKNPMKNCHALYRDWETDRKSTRLNSSHRSLSRMPSSA